MLSRSHTAVPRCQALKLARPMEASEARQNTSRLGSSFDADRPCAAAPASAAAAVAAKKPTSQRRSTRDRPVLGQPRPYRATLMANTPVSTASARSLKVTVGS